MQELAFAIATFALSLSCNTDALYELDKSVQLDHHKYVSALAFSNSPKCLVVSQGRNTLISLIELMVADELAIRDAAGRKPKIILNNEKYWKDQPFTALFSRCDQEGAWTYYRLMSPGLSCNNSELGWTPPLRLEIYDLLKQEETPFSVMDISSSAIQFSRSGQWLIEGGFSFRNSSVPVNTGKTTVAAYPRRTIDEITARRKVDQTLRINLSGTPLITESATVLSISVSDDDRFLVIGG